jgi:hypothetical protein
MQRLVQDALGLGTKKTSGRKAKVYLSAANRNGGKAASDNLITTKFVPHTATIANASNK